MSASEGIDSPAGSEGSVGGVSAAGTTTDRDPGERPIGYWLKLVDRLIDQDVDEVFLRTGLTRRHWQVLNMVRDGVSDVTTVDSVLSPFTTGGAARPGGHAPAVSAEISDLQARGWVTQGGAGWEVTVAGQHAYHDLLDAVSLSRERLAEGITREQYDRTIATLEQMARNLGWSPGT
ncbi:hypothetical protein ASE27_02965 [Oerskovia sp. Root918]|uniref:hypothetical protein n=1 Tax=Oerskovia sp. Root918 TaxID=1736607 RepID=UPI0006F35BB7|nr:hypothetical protein [Oerskovia sp. Root918]KRD47329.1 hypothetical protein ASE27_02965 [Oerskovia sp. Root918]